MSRSTIYKPQPYRAARAAHSRTAIPSDESEGVQLLAALRANQQILRDLMLRYDAGRVHAVSPPRLRAAPTICSPQDVWELFGEEMSELEHLARRLSRGAMVLTPGSSPYWESGGRLPSVLQVVVVQEQLRVLLLDTKHKLIRWEVVYQGTVDAITVRPSELIRLAVLENAPAMLLVHNHPSGDPSPSPEDIRTTEHTMAAGDLLSIDVLDHVVLGKNGKYATIRGRGLVQHRTQARAA